MEDLNLPNRLFAFGEEPSGERINCYHKSKRIDMILEALTEDEVEQLKDSPFSTVIATGQKSALSGSFGHFLLCRMLKVIKKHEIWFLFAGRPIRFSLREFGIVIGLRCWKYPKRSKKTKRSNMKGTPYWPVLFGLLSSVDVNTVVRMLKKKSVTDPALRIKYACLAIVASVLLPTSHNPKISKEHVELIRKLDDFYAYPWGRASFDTLVNSIKRKDEVALSRSTVTIKGFVLAIQLVMLQAVPLLLDGVQINEASSSDYDSEEEVA